MNILPNTNVNDIKNNFSEKGYYGVLYISDLLVIVPNAIQLISKQQPPIGLLDHIAGSLKKEIEKKKLLAYNIENLDEILETINTSVNLRPSRLMRKAK